MFRRNLFPAVCGAILVLIVSGSLHGQPYNFQCVRGDLDEMVTITWQDAPGTSGNMFIYANGQQVVDPPPSVGNEQVVINTRGWAANDYSFDVYYQVVDDTPEHTCPFSSFCPPAEIFEWEHPPTPGFDIPNDEFFSSQWSLHNVGQTVGPADVDIDLAQAWTIEAGSSDVIVAVIEKKIDWHHRDLQYRMVPGVDFGAFGTAYDQKFWEIYETQYGSNPADWNAAEEAALVAVREDQLTYNFAVDPGGFDPFAEDALTRPSWDPDAYDPEHLFASTDPYVPVTDTSSIPGYQHSTRVAGIIAAQRNNQYGIAGIAGGTSNLDGVRILPVVIHDMGDWEHPGIPGILTPPAYWGTPGGYQWERLVMADHVATGLEYVIYMKQELGVNIRVVSLQYPSRFPFNDSAEMQNPAHPTEGPHASDPNSTWGADVYTYAYDRINDAIENADAAGILIVSAASNDGCSSAGSNVIDIAGHPLVLGVADLTLVGGLSPISSCGSSDPDENQLDLSAPGSQIPTTATEGQGDNDIASAAPAGEPQIDAYVANECGTSWSAPHVAGVAALLFSLDPSMTPAKARCILRGTADDLGSPIYYGEGRVNAYRALLEANGQPSLPGDLNGDGTVNDADVQMLTAYLGQFGSPSQPECLMDVNADNSIDSRDESTLKSHVMSGSPDLLVRPGCDRVGPPLCQ